MVLVSGLEKNMSLDTRGRLGFTSGCGLARCGYSRCGASKRFGGIYSRKKTKRGHGISRMRYYMPTNPQTEMQQNWRAVFTAGVGAWRLLTDGERIEYNKIGRKYRMTGYNLFLRRYLTQN